MAKLERPDVEALLDKLNYSRVVGFAVFFIAAGGVFYHYVEKFSWLNSFYFTFVTLATVGYGDYVPKTAAGKVFTMFYILFGITIFIALARIILANAAARQQKRKK